MKDKKNIVVLILIFLSIMFIALKVGNFADDIESLEDKNSSLTNSINSRVKDLEISNIELAEKVDKLLENKQESTNFEKLFNIEVLEFNENKAKIRLNVIPKYFDNLDSLVLYNDNSEKFELLKNDINYVNEFNIDLNTSLPIFTSAKSSDSNSNIVNEIFKLTPEYNGIKLLNHPKTVDLVFDKLMYNYSSKNVVVKSDEINYNYNYKISKVNNFRNSEFINHVFYIEKNGQKLTEINLNDQSYLSDGRYNFGGKIDYTLKDKVNFVIKSTNTMGDEYISYLSKIENGFNTIDGETLIEIYVNGKKVNEYYNK